MLEIRRSGFRARKSLKGPLRGRAAVSDDRPIPGRASLRVERDFVFL
jgi:hypothetical protein